jgi:acyl-CoA thioesterase
LTETEQAAWLEYIGRHFKKVPIFNHLDAKIVRLAIGEADVSLCSRAEYANTYGITHGGIVAALVDMAAGVAMRTLKIRLVTVEMSTNYFAPTALDAQITAYAKMVHQGRRLAAAEVDVRDDAGRLVAKGKATFFVTGEDYLEEKEQG